MTPPAADSSLIERLRAATSGEYEIVRELGRGGFATVYLGRDLALERRAHNRLVGVVGLRGGAAGERAAREQDKIERANLKRVNMLAQP